VEVYGGDVCADYDFLLRLDYHEPENKETPIKETTDLTGYA